ncbi:hypothetical protein TTHERM_00294820 (macronuclear) [Tetrahymena thermophila SB210]|uniref:Uncharacterized protein n=1 Tax=Tetrahymena thermophila (strain SB210) TaxID=312017 RepID=I7MIC2_TETTS|nr:hypothetical protein TTHERM_00294820 [Tetrahymena thermophila SB210]EAR92869.1 hypothetical protein TTHERM_00294820 [Tetrahymena thermophila SB210]|eukprot:XP_001013114.1 hypothetical protein TTHERM_00294820 [Tetrahymena thermophila SB210]
MNNSQTGCTLIFEMWFLKVYYQQSQQQITIEYHIHENTSKQGSFGIVAFETLKREFLALKQSEEVQKQYPYLFSKIEVSDKLVRHIIDLNFYEVIDYFQQSEEDQIKQYNSLLQQMIFFFQQEQYICSYNFNKIIKLKYKNIYSFLIFPGLISFEDSSERGINLQDDVKKLVRPQISHRTDKKLEILTFMKNFVIQKYEKQFQEIVKYFREDLELLAKENIILKNNKIEGKSYCLFNLAYDINRNLNHDQNIEKYKENKISFTFQLEKCDEKLSNLLYQICLYMDNENNLKQKKKQINEYVSQEKEQRQKIEEAFNTFYEEDYKQEDKLQKNFQKLESEIQIFSQIINNNDNFILNEKPERIKYIDQLREDMKKYRETILENIKIQKQMNEFQ